MVWKSEKTLKPKEEVPISLTQLQQIISWSKRGLTRYFKMNINDMILWIKKHNPLVERDNKSMFSTSFWFLFCGEGPMQALEVTNNRRNLMNSIALTFLWICYFLTFFCKIF